MRIAFLLTSSLTSPYGLGRCFPLARELAAAGHELHIVALHHDLGPSVPRHSVRSGVRIHYAGQMHARKVSDTTIYYSTPRLLSTVIAGTLGLVREASRINADIYHIGKPHPQNSIAGLAAGRLLKRRRLFLDCDDLEAQSNRLGGEWQRRILGWFEDRVPCRVDGVTVHSQFLHDRILALGVPPARVLRLPNGVDRERFGAVPPSAMQLWRDRLGLGDRRVVTYVGTMSLANHPVDLLLRAFAHLVRTVDDAMLLLVGGGADLGRLEHLAHELGIADRCRFAGRVEPEQIPALMSLSLATVDPVYDDEVARARWPLKIVESMAVGVPVVTGDVGDRREMLGDQRAGLAVAPGEPEALADGLQALLEDPVLHGSLSEGCRSQADTYDLKDLASRLLSFYEKV